MRKALIAGLMGLLVIASTMGQAPKKVVITSLGPPYSRIGEKELAEFRAAAPKINLVVAEDKAKMMAEVADADGIIGTINPEIIRAARKLRWVQVHSAGVEGVLTPEMKESAITLTNCKIVMGPEIADHAFALLLSLTRDLYRIIPRRVKEEWPRDEYHPIELLGKRAAIFVPMPPTPMMTARLPKSSMG